MPHRESAEYLNEIEFIMFRQWASALAIPMALFDTQGTMLFYNEPAETLLGRRFEETGAMPATEWSTVFTPLDDESKQIPPEALPLMITLKSQRPVYKRMHIRGLDGLAHHIEVASIPIAGLRGDFLGAAALFWELSA